MISQNNSNTVIIMLVNIYEMRIIALMLFSLSLSTSALAQTEARKDFDKILREYEIEFIQPENFEEVPIIENGDLFYNYSIKFKDIDFEVRYSIFLIKPELEDYEASLTDPNRIMVNPNKLYKQMFIANILNVSQSGIDNIPKTGEFNPEAVKEEFGADQGGTSFFVANSEFAKDYEYCMMIVLHKEDMADVYVSFLGNDREKFQEYMLLAFHSIRFR